MRLLSMEKIKFFFIVFLSISRVCFSQESEAKLDLMYTYFEKGQSKKWVQKDSAYFHFEEATKLAKEIEDYGSLLGILDNIVITANYHEDLEKYQTSLKRMDSLLSNVEIRKEIEEIDYWDTAYLGKLALLYLETKENTKAKDIFLKIISDWKAMPYKDLDDTEAEMYYSINGYLGTIYRRQGKYELAEQYYLNNISLVTAHDLFAPYRDSYETGVQQSLAQLYTQMGEHKKANTFYVKNLKWSKEFYAKDKKYKNNLLNAYQKITISYIVQDSLQKALFFLEQSKPYLLPKDPFYKDALLLYGDIYSGLNEKEDAFNAFQRALENFTEFRNNKPHQDISEVHGKIARLHLKHRGYQAGLKTIQNAFNMAGNDIRITDDVKNPDPNDVFSKIQLLNLLDIKLQLLQQSFVITGERIYQKAFLQTSRDILKTFDLLKNEFDSKVDKRFLAEKAYPIFHRILETVFIAYKEDRSKETLQLALAIAEKNKDFVLLEALRNSQATQYGNVPKDVLEREYQLRAEITNVEKQLFDTTANESGYSDTLFQLKQEYFDFLDTLKVKYPKYHELKYQNRILNLEKIRIQLLEDNQTLVSFTMAEDHLYAIIINGSKEDFLKLPFNEFDREAIRTFYGLLSRPSINGSEKEIHELGNTLYEKILQKPLENYVAENLIIIPDGELHYLPFDLLQENGSYLLETKSIGYGNSVTSLLELKEKPSSKKNNLLAFAPSFSGVVTESLERQFGKLLYNDDEVHKIGGFFGSEVVLKEEATLSNFKSNASRFNIVHLATHASANDEYPDYSYLAFTKTKDSTESNILYIKDLYNMTLNANMVTLSACQTGIGKLQKGQGMMSLSKGFYYAGAKSIVNTLWKINDKSTVQLMENFYEELSRGKSKTEALRLAKLKYLESTDDELLKHPYYWAAFVVSGDASPITNNNTLMWVLGLGFIPLLLVGFFSKRRKDFKKIQLVN